MVKEIDLEAGTRLRLKEIHEVELLPREGEKSALHYVKVNGVRLHIHQHRTGTVRISVHGMKKHGERVHDILTFDEITIFNPKGKISKKKASRKGGEWTDILIN
jgi:hypothetical protein